VTSLWDRLLGRGPVVDHALELAAEPSFEIDWNDIDPAMLGLPAIAEAAVPIAGRISRREAIQAPALKRARDLIAGTLGGLPLRVYDAENVDLVNDLLVQPERNTARMVTMTRTIEDLLFEGVAYWRVTERRFDGYPAYVEYVAPWRVSNDGTKIDGLTVRAADLIRFDSAADPLLVAGARAIRTLLKIEAAVATYADEPAALQYFTPQDGIEPPSDDEVKAFLNSWKAARKVRATGYVPANVKLNTDGSFSPEDLQLSEQVRNAITEIANLTGLDSEALNVSTTSRTYFNATQKRQDFIDFTLALYAKAVEDRLSMGDVTKRGQLVRFDYADFLRADALTRMNVYEKALAVGAITQPEIRAAEHKPTLPEDVTAVPNTETPVPTATKFDGPELEIQLDAPAAEAQFKVDMNKRTIKGLAVPYGSPAQSKGRLWQFSKGSLSFGDPSRVKLLAGHDWTRAIGYAVELEDTDAGLIATFKVARGDAGDEALILAEDRVWDGLSVGVGLGGTYDERDGVFHAVSAPLAEVSLTPCPAFDSARVHEVAASKQTEKELTMTETVTPEAENSSVNFDKLAEAITAAVKAAQPAPGEGPEVITPTLQVNEPLPYRFDGLRGEHEFSSDLFASAGRNDSEATERLTKFMADAFANGGPKFNVSTSNVASVNPSVQRPDLFVDQLSYVTPVWDAINKGGLSDGTPFIAPKWASESGLVGDHTQGTEPTGGAYATTSQTITPGPLSGKYDINREVVDAGGNPQVSGLIWRGVLRAYYEALEAKAVALLDGLTPTAIALTTAAADDVLSGEIEAAFAGLHFVRGGDRFDKLVLQEDLYKAIVAARDADGRPLYPVLGAVNANGQTASGLGTVNIGGKVGVPAWALGASGTVSESSYLFSSDDVHGWATAPQSLRFEYQVATVTFGVWGYQATANTRLAGVREITYDPAA
jgi:HK97 family phage prohead protease